MCFKTPKPPPVKPTPQRDTNAALVQDNVKRVSEQQGIYGSISTSPLGDSTYSQNAQKLAKLGGR